MNPKEAFLTKTGSYRTHLFRYMYLCNRQDVAPFPPAISCRKTVAKASQDLIPPPFVMRMQQRYKRTLEIKSNKKALLSYIQKGFVEYL